MESEALLRQLLGDEVVDRLLREESGAALIAGAPRWLDDLLRAKASLPLPEVPAIVTQDLQDVFDRHLLPRRLDAVLVSDSRTQRRLAGVRGDVAQADGWSVTYTCEAADILLDIWEDDGTIEVDGQVMTHGGRTSAFHARAVGQVSRLTESDGLGRFRFVDLPSGAYRFVVNNRRLEVGFEADLGSEPT